jgi:phospholipid transport system substrate-binding protein
MVTIEERHLLYRNGRPNFDRYIPGGSSEEIAMAMARIVSYARTAGIALPPIGTAVRKSARNIAALPGAILLAFAVWANPGAAVADGPQDSVHSFYQALLGAMKEGRTLGQSGRFARIDPVVRRLFDIRSMTRVAVGGTWTTLSTVQQGQVTAAFASYISAMYADRFDIYSGQQLEVTGQHPSGSAIMVRTRITKASGEPVGITTCCAKMMVSGKSRTSTSTA